MKILRSRLIPISALLLTLICSGVQGQAAEIQFQQVPDRGIQPRLLRDGSGNVHLLYFKKRFNNPRSFEGTLVYRQLQADNSWSEEITVSSIRYQHRDPISRADFAIDDQGRIHAVWLDRKDDSYWYARSDTSRKSFGRAEKIVQVNATGIDAAADVSASGNMVAIVWASGDLSQEDSRQLFTRISSDHGASFGDETVLSDPKKGACSCCTLASILQNDHLVVSYRSAVNNTGRHMQILRADINISERTVDSFSYDELLDEQLWDLAACPVTSNDLLMDPEGNIWMIFESRNRTAFMQINDKSSIRRLMPDTDVLRQKHPALAIANDGSKLIAWGEGAGFTSGGELRATVFSADEQDLSGPLTVPEVEIRDFSNVAVTAVGPSSFLVLY